MSSCFSPPHYLSLSKTCKPPDYSNSKFWSALPWKKDSADCVVKNSNLVDGQLNAPVDVFYIHPTTYIYGTLWNADPEDSVIVARTDKFPIRYHASIFNGSCKVYAPRYREAEFFTYLSRKQNKKAVFDIAYSDIRSSFLYYLKHYNKGRPFIIASHSQGTQHAVRLCREFLDNDSALHNRLVAAYLVGDLVYEKNFKTLKPCDSSCQTGCYVSWNTVRWGEFTFFGKPVLNAVCVNPLTWKRTNERARATLNQGALPVQFDGIARAATGAKCSPNGLLWIHRPKQVFKDYSQFSKRYYHILDYNLFYMNVRNNVKERIDTWIRLQETTNLSANSGKR